MADLKKLLVNDSNCTKDKRTHVIIVDGVEVSVTFSPGNPVELPFAQGVKFLMPGFVVTDIDGTVYNEPGGNKRDGEVGLTLKPGEVVANLEELTNASLVIRANQISGGEKLSVKTKKVDLIDFLTSKSNAGNSSDAESESADGEEDLIEDEMTDAELDANLPTG